MTRDAIPKQAQIIDRIQESPSIFTLRLRLTDERSRQDYLFAPGQFNMVYLYGVGEVPISIVSDPDDTTVLDHTIRALGRVTQGLAQLKTGDRIGLRGPYGRGWPLREAEGNDILVITGGLGCAPVVAVIQYILMRREQFGRLTIIQGVKHADDLIWRERYAEWSAMPNTHVLLAADHGGPLWPWHVGLVTELFDEAEIVPDRTTVMMCGPEGMMRAGIPDLASRGIPEQRIYLSMERNMKCAVGHCGHCQYGPTFICKDGPVFSYPQVKELFHTRGF